MRAWRTHSVVRAYGVRMWACVFVSCRAGGKGACKLHVVSSPCMRPPTGCLCRGLRGLGSCRQGAEHWHAVAVCDQALASAQLLHGRHEGVAYRPS